MKVICLPIQCCRNITYFVFNICKEEEKFEYREDLPEHIHVTFNTWVYQGSDLLWASLLEVIWKSIEAKHGKGSVTLHRAKVALSGELDGDDPETRRSKREAAIYREACNVFLGISVAVFTAVYTSVEENPIAFVGLDDIYNKIILQVTATSPLVAILFKIVKKVLPELRNPGTRILNEINSFGKCNRDDFTKETGYMGRVKKEMEYVYDYLKTQRIRDEKLQILRDVRLFIFIDDLDRCVTKTIMDVLEAVPLLLVNAPVTIWIAIDSRVVVNSIEEHMGTKLKDEGLDGYAFLEKIVQIPFCLPDLAKEVKANFMQNSCRRCKSRNYSE